MFNGQVKEFFPRKVVLAVNKIFFSASHLTTGFVFLQTLAT